MTQRWKKGKRCGKDLIWGKEGKRLKNTKNKRRKMKTNKYLENHFT
jgi:hypothetical protein